MNFRPFNVITSLAIISIGAVAGATSAPAAPNAVDFAMYFDADARDADECAMTVEDGKTIIDSAVVNPSMSCPDMFSWKLFAEVILENWWSSWASDTQTWPKEPYRLCAAGEIAPACCQPRGADNPGYGDVTTDPDYPNSLHCPFFPGVGIVATAVAQPRRLGKPIGAHAISLGTGGLAAQLAAPPGAAALGRPGEPEPGRVIRQEVGEITVRNKPMFDYIFNNNLYNQNGIAAVFNRNATNLANNAPYQATNSPKALTKIDLPIPAIMIKSNWLYHEFATAVGLIDDPSAPYIKKDMITTIGDKTYRGEHWLVAFHISTKDIPQWVWTTFEHVNNPGRCDFTGCNDSYGFASDDARPDAGNTRANFTAPHVRNDGLGQSSVIFNLGLRYTSGPISSELSTILSALGIGLSGQQSAEPAPVDRAWLSYRLKGSQVNFTNAMGRATRLGNSITEGGFMNTSSCISCHARAAVTATGDEKKQTTVPFGVFAYDVLSEVGYQQSNFGIPDKNWYHGSGSRPVLQALQTDFMWGMPFFAKPLSSPK